MSKIEKKEPTERELFLTSDFLQYSLSVGDNISIAAKRIVRDKESYLISKIGRFAYESQKNHFIEIMVMQTLDKIHMNACDVFKDTGRKMSQKEIIRQCENAVKDQDFIDDSLMEDIEECIDESPTVDREEINRKKVNFFDKSITMFMELYSILQKYAKYIEEYESKEEAKRAIEKDIEEIVKRIKDIKEKEEKKRSFQTMIQDLKIGSGKDFAQKSLGQIKKHINEIGESIKIELRSNQKSNFDDFMGKVSKNEMSYEEVRDKLIDFSSDSLYGEKQTDNQKMISKLREKITEQKNRDELPTELTSKSIIKYRLVSEAIRDELNNIEVGLRKIKRLIAEMKGVTPIQENKKDNTVAVEKKKKVEPQKENESTGPSDTKKETSSSIIDVSTEHIDPEMEDNEDDIMHIIGGEVTKTGSALEGVFNFLDDNNDENMPIAEETNDNTVGEVDSPEMLGIKTVEEDNSKDISSIIPQEEDDVFDPLSDYMGMGEDEPDNPYENDSIMKI